MSCDACGVSNIPDGSKCFDCACASVAEWLEERKRVAREPKPKKGRKK